MTTPISPTARLAELEAQLAQLTKELAAAQKDTARLDWLETYSFAQDRQLFNMRDMLDEEIAKHARQALSSSAAQLDSPAHGAP